MQMTRPLNEKQIFSLAQEYKSLGKHLYLSNSDETRLSQILEVAQSNDILSNLLETIDLELGDELDILDGKSKEEDEQIRENLRARLKVAWLEHTEP